VGAHPPRLNPIMRKDLAKIRHHRHTYARVEIFPRSVVLCRLGTYELVVRTGSVERAQLTRDTASALGKLAEALSFGAS